MYIAGEAKLQNVPTQVVNANYSAPPAACSSAEGVPATSPAQAGFNGILGVGLFKQDCGANCTQGTNGMYYSCATGFGRTASGKQ